MDSVSESRLAEVHPELARRVRLLVNKCVPYGIWLRVSQGLRTWQQQGLLYAQGRTEPGKIVTNARAGYSMHQFGLAVDIVPADANFPTFVPDWDSMDSRWQQVLELAETCQLREGAQWRTFPDRPHLYPKEIPADPDENMRYLFSEGGLKAVWDEVKLQEVANGL
jgi:peptidoglycan L-alanyl-D-glutamate endopeptidase CwlK